MSDAQTHTSPYGVSRLWLRAAITWLITALGLHFAALIIPGVDVDGNAAALGGAAILGLLNAFVWPLLSRIALPLTVLTLGFASVILNGLVLWVASEVSEGMRISSIWTGIGAVAVLTLVNALVTTLLSIDDDDFYYRRVIKRRAKRKGAVESDVPGAIFLEIDGLGHEIMLRALRDGDAPTMARWVRDRGHHLLRWNTDWSSQTGAAQTGILHGSNDDIPAFRWWDKEAARAVASSNPKDIMELEARVSNGRGLLFADGASRANMYSGDAPHSLLTMSTVLRRDRPGKIGEDYFAYFINPYNMIRTILLVIGDIASEFKDAADQKRKGIYPRAPHRGIVYSLVRAWTTVVQRDLQVQAVIGDIYLGRPVVYTTFTGYDELAHHSGTERAETLKILRRLDRQFGRIERAATDGPRPYRLVVLSDHGQTQGATFKQRYDLTLEDLVKQACGTEHVRSGGATDEGRMYIGATMTEMAQGEGAMAGGVRLATRRRAGEIVEVGDEGAADRQLAEDELTEVIVMASGCLGLVFFPREPGRVSLERIGELYPNLIPTLRAHEGIGFMLVRSDQHGAVVIGRDGISYLEENRVEGANPLEGFGPHAAEVVLRTHGFSNCGDIMVNSTYWSELEEVAAFEDLIGSHGGLGGAQNHPFLLIPNGWTRPEQPIVGAGHVHAWLRRWLAEAGHAEYAESAVD